MYNKEKLKLNLKLNQTNVQPNSNPETNLDAEPKQKPEVNLDPADPGKNSDTELSNNRTGQNVPFTTNWNPIAGYQKRNTIF